MTIKLHQLKYFLHVAEEGSISKAAGLLNVAQPAVSQNIASLEHHFQSRLFTRSSRGVTPTREGKVLLEYARTILLQVDRATSEIRSLDAGASGEVIVALPSASAVILASRLIRAVAASYPDITLSITESMSGRTSEIITEGHADLALVPNGHLLRDVEAETVLTESLHFGGLETDTLSGTGEIDFEEVCKHPLIMPVKPNFVRGSLEQAAFDRGYPLNIVAEQSSGRLIQTFLADGLGYSVLTWPSFYANFRNGGFFVKKIVNPEFPRPMTLAWQKKGLERERTRAVRQVLREVVRQAHADGFLRGTLEPSKD